jgi:hypothetical protein
LTLVLEIFDPVVLRVAHQSDLLENFCRRSYFYQRFNIHLEGNKAKIHREFHQSYIQRLVLCTPPENYTTSFRYIVETADALCMRSDIPKRSRTEYIKALCGDAEIYFPCPSAIFHAEEYELQYWQSSDPELILFTAALNLNLMSIVQDLIDRLFKRYGSKLPGCLFGNPYIRAAEKNKWEILELLFKKASVSPTLLPSWLNHELLNCLISASASDSLETVNWILDDKERREILLDLINERFDPTGSVGSKEDAHYWVDRMLLVPTQRIFSRLHEFRQTSLFAGRIYRFWEVLKSCVYVHNVEMIRWLVTTHWQEPQNQAPLCGCNPGECYRSPPGNRYLHNWPLKLACATGQTEAVRLLLDYTASLGTMPELVAHAAAGGHLETVKMLVERGYSVDLSDLNCGYIPSPIVSSIGLEHVAMFRYLREQGADFGVEIQKDAVGRAKAGGLQSMLELLAQEGVDTGTFPVSELQQRHCGHRGCGTQNLDLDF